MGNICFKFPRHICKLAYHKFCCLFSSTSFFLCSYLVLASSRCWSSFVACQLTRRRDVVTNWSCLFFPLFFCLWKDVAKAYWDEASHLRRPGDAHTHTHTHTYTHEEAVSCWSGDTRTRAHTHTHTYPFPRAHTQVRYFYQYFIEMSGKIFFGFANYFFFFSFIF